MKTTNKNLETPRFANPLAEEIQSLADGQLDAESRTRLLRRIDASEEPHWRSLALALIERDLIGEAFEMEPAAGPVIPAAPRHRPLVWLAAAAACVALGCFFLGWQLKPAAENPSTGIAAQLPEPIDPGTGEPEPETAASIVEQANRQLASSGYQASLFTRFVKTSLEDGRQVVIPVSQVVLDPRGL